MSHIEGFEQIRLQLEAESELREKIRDATKELDTAVRQITSLLNRVHSTPSSELPHLISNASSHFPEIQPRLEAIAELVPPKEYHKWEGLWSRSMQTLVFAAGLIKFLEKQELVAMDEVSKLIGIKPEWSDRLALYPEEFLHGVISVVNELSRLAVNSVTLGDFERPLQISSFVKDVFGGFQLLNLKNDSLRRRFDSLKYDVNKIEGVVYDISLRGLVKTSGAIEAGKVTEGSS